MLHLPPAISARSRIDPSPRCPGAGSGVVIEEEASSVVADAHQDARAILRQSDRNVTGVRVFLHVH